MAEWSKALDSKSSLRLAVTRVRIPFPPFFWAFLHWRGGRVVEGARLEIVYTPKGYRGFESHPLCLRQHSGDVTQID